MPLIVLHLLELIGIVEAQSKDGAPAEIAAIKLNLLTFKPYIDKEISSDRHLNRAAGLSMVTRCIYMEIRIYGYPYVMAILISRKACSIKVGAFDAAGQGIETGRRDCGRRWPGASDLWPAAGRSLWWNGRL